MLPNDSAVEEVYLNSSLLDDLAKWIDGRNWETIDMLSEKLWEKVDLSSFV